MSEKIKILVAALSTDYWQKADDLAAALGTKPERTQQPLRKIALEGNLVGEPIISCRQGYKLASNTSELTTYALSLESRGKENINRAKAVRTCRPRIA